MSRFVICFLNGSSWGPAEGSTHNHPLTHPNGLPRAKPSQWHFLESAHLAQNVSSVALLPAYCSAWQLISAPKEHQSQIVKPAVNHHHAWKKSKIQSILWKAYNFIKKKLIFGEIFLERVLMNTIKTNSCVQCGHPRRSYTKAKMQVVKIESEGFFTQSGATTRQIEGFGKENTNDWFASPSAE